MFLYEPLDFICCYKEFVNSHSSPVTCLTACAAAFGPMQFEIVVVWYIQVGKQFLSIVSCQFIIFFSRWMVFLFAFLAQSPYQPLGQYAQE